MNYVFRLHLRDFVVVYLDDILIYSKTEEEHRRHVRIVLDILRKEKFFACVDKSTFAQQECKFLGHIIGKDGVKVDPRKIEAVENWPIPKDQHQVRSFLGLANYFRRFIQGFSTLAAPLSALTKASVAYEWTPKCHEAFEGIKHALTHAPVLVSPDSSKHFTVVCDASLVGVGGVLLQDERPVAFESRKLSPAELNYTTGEQELLAVVHCLTVWRCYLEGPQFTVITDHCPNTYLQTQPNLSRRQARWLEFLQRFNMKWIYRAGRTNVADPLSRYPVSEAAYLTLLLGLESEREPGSMPDGHPVPSTSPSGAWKTRYDAPKFGLPPLLRKAILLSYTKDPSLSDVSSERVQQLCINSEGFLLRDNRIYIPPNDELKRVIMEECHDSLYSGHFGLKKTEKAVARMFIWDGQRSDLSKFVSTCATCLRNKPRQRRPGGLIQSVEIPSSPWESISFDLITDLPKTDTGYDAIAVFVDQLTKLAHFAPTTKTVSAEGFARLYVDHWFRLHGLSDKFISDRDPRFTSRFWEELTRLIGTRLALSSSFHAETDGLTERLNRTLETYLRHYVSADQSDWNQYLSLAEFAYNSAWQESVKASPFQLTYGKQPKAPIGRTPASPVPGARALAERLALGISRAKGLLIQAKSRQKSFADHRRREVEYEVGDKVLLSTKFLPIRFTGSPKLLPRYVGPFAISAKIGSVAYRLELPAHYRIHPVFHVSLLEPYRSDGRYQPPPPPLEIDGALEYEVDRILAHRTIKRGKRRLLEFLVAWQNYGPEHNSWEPERNLKNAKTSIAEYWQRTGRTGPQLVGGPHRDQGVPARVGGTERVSRKRTSQGRVPSGEPRSKRNRRK